MTDSQNILDVGRLSKGDSFELLNEIETLDSGLYLGEDTVIWTGSPMKSEAGTILEVVYKIEDIVVVFGNTNHFQISSNTPVKLVS